MNYELAKELKDAGFTKCNQWLSTVSGQYFPRIDNDGYFDTLPWPTLSELIEACGEEFDYLVKVKVSHLWVRGGWYGEATRKGVTVNLEDDLSDTPEEAVASLWLALRRKEI